MSLKTTLLLIPLLPLLGAALSGLGRNLVGRAGAHWITILAVGASCGLSFQVLWWHLQGVIGVENISIYTWMVSDGIRFEVGF
ncbi:MAG: NADH-quinone oxidoreductase subunit L, partial [Xanthomonadales bacterium]|nr:NADH-quinone oxidoreductase subunit L [Xanthomonadales bacterium]